MERTSETERPCDCALGGGYPSCSLFWALGRYSTTEGRQHVDDAMRAEREKRRALAEAGDWRIQLERMGVPLVIIGALSRLQENQTVQAARQFLRLPRDVMPGLALLGPTGLGKTVAAAVVLQDLAKRWDWNGGPTGETVPPAMFLGGREFTRLSAFDDGDRRRYANAKRTRLLVLDDLGDEATDFAKGHAVDLLMERLDGNRRTVLTSNLSPEAFRRRYGDALSDRVKHRTLHPRLEGGSLRKRGGP